MAKHHNGRSKAAGSKAIVDEHLRMSKRVSAKVLSSPQSAKAFLIKAGIVDKSGKRLAKPYR